MRFRWIIPLVVMLILINPSLEVVDSIQRHVGSDSLGPGHESRFYLHAVTGELVQLSYETSLYPVECVLYGLQEFNRSMSVYDVRVEVFPRIYSHIGMGDRIELMATEYSDYILTVLNTANITQQFEYEWISKIPGYETQLPVILVTMPLIYVFVFGICLLFLRKRHRQLVQRTSVGPENSPDVF